VILARRFNLTHAVLADTHALSQIGNVFRLNSLQLGLTLLKL